MTKVNIIPCAEECAELNSVPTVEGKKREKGKKGERSERVQREGNEELVG